MFGQAANLKSMSQCMGHQSRKGHSQPGNVDLLSHPEQWPLAKPFPNATTQRTGLLMLKN